MMTIWIVLTIIFQTEEVQTKSIMLMILIDSVVSKGAYKIRYKLNNIKFFITVSDIFISKK